MIRVLVADDHHLVRQGIRALLERQPDIRSLVRPRMGSRLSILPMMPNRVSLLDINMPLLNGIEVTRRVKRCRAKHPGPNLSMYPQTSSW